MSGSCLDYVVLIFPILCNIFKALYIHVYEILRKTGEEMKFIITKPYLARLCTYICKHKYTKYYNKDHYQNYLNQVLNC